MDVGFFSSRRRHTVCWRDWSSGVCSSDLGGPGVGAEEGEQLAVDGIHDGSSACSHETSVQAVSIDASRRDRRVARDRKSVVQGKSVDPGGRSNIKKKKVLSNVYVSTCPLP